MANKRTTRKSAAKNAAAKTKIPAKTVKGDFADP